MARFLRILAIGLVALLLPACGGATFGCKRNADGTVECAVTTHPDGKHEDR